MLRVVDLVTGKVRFEVGRPDAPAVDRFFAVMGFTDQGVTRETAQEDAGETWTAKFPGASAYSILAYSSSHECRVYGDAIVKPAP